MDLLNVEGCVGIRVFPSSTRIRVINPDYKMAFLAGEENPEEAHSITSSFPTLIIIGVDENGNDLGTSNSEFQENPYTLSLMPCPPQCGQGNTSAPLEDFEEES